MFVKFHPDCAMYGTYFVRLSSEKSHRARKATELESQSSLHPPKTPRPQDPEYCLNSTDTHRRMIMVQITRRNKKMRSKRSKNAS